jgi:hypothetical protein
MKEYDSAKNMETRIAAGQRLDEAVSELSDKQMPQLVKMCLRGGRSLAGRRKSRLRDETA